MTISNIRELTADDRSALIRFLKPHTEQTLFLQYNILRGGLTYEGKPGQSIFWGLFEGREITAVLSLSWNGYLQVFAPKAIDQFCEVLTAFLRREERIVCGINGLAQYVRQMLLSLGLTQHPKSIDNDEDLFSLNIGNLQIPIDRKPGLKLREVLHSDLELLVEWQIGYAVETLGYIEDKKLREGTQKRIEALIKLKPSDVRILEYGGSPVSRTNFSASTPDAVMLGGIWTPPELRNKGYARTAIAAHLLEVAKTGVSKAVLFTSSPAATKVYKSLGFKAIGLFGFVIFDPPWSP